jgi:hypothetical protein
MMADQIEKLRNERTRSTTMRQTEDPLSMAQRHVAEGEKRVEHQAILIAELDRAGRIELAVQISVPSPRASNLRFVPL